MKVGIVGDAERALAWEKHLRPHQIVQEVDLSPSLKEVRKVDACFLLDDTVENLDHLLKAIRRGLNCFLISKAPTDTQKLDKIHRAGKEAGVHVQFSHWPTLAPATQWMMNRIDRPSIMSITREVNYTQMTNKEEDFRHYWIDELGLCMKWMGSGIHHTEAREVKLESRHSLICHLFLRFENGSSADIRIYAGAHENSHKRIISNKNEVLECDVPAQMIRAGRLNSGGHLFYDKQAFDPAKSAEKSALIFLKAIQMNREAAYSSYDAYQLAMQVERVEKRFKQFS